MGIPTAIAILVSAAGIWLGAIAMIVAHVARAKDAKADREALRAAIDGLRQQGAALERLGAAFERQGAALERQGGVLAELIRRTAPPSSQGGPAEWSLPRRRDPRFRRGSTGAARGAFGPAPRPPRTRAGMAGPPPPRRDASAAGGSAPIL